MRMCLGGRTIQATDCTKCRTARTYIRKGHQTAPVASRPISQLISQTNRPAPDPVLPTNARQTNDQLRHARTTIPHAVGEGWGGNPETATQTVVAQQAEIARLERQVKERLQASTESDGTSDEPAAVQKQHLTVAELRYFDRAESCARELEKEKQREFQMREAAEQMLEVEAQRCVSLWCVSLWWV